MESRRPATNSSWDLAQVGTAADPRSENEKNEIKWTLRSWLTRIIFQRAPISHREEVKALHQCVTFSFFCHLASSSHSLRLPLSFPRNSRQEESICPWTFVVQVTLEITSPGFLSVQMRKPRPIHVTGSTYHHTATGSTFSSSKCATLTLSLL